MKKITQILIIGLLVLAIAGIVSAANENKTVDSKKNETAKNMTYGQCVSEGASIKNTCYSDVKAVKDSCMNVAKNQTDVKTASQACNNNYKQEKKQCKAEFKKAKNECKKIKHNFLETIGSSMK